MGRNIGINIVFGQVAFGLFILFIFALTALMDLFGRAEKYESKV